MFSSFLNRFVGYKTLREANEAIRRFDGYSLEGGRFTLRVSIALSAEDKRARDNKKAVSINLF